LFVSVVVIVSDDGIVVDVLLAAQPPYATWQGSTPVVVTLSL
jgi:hypothetical protein